jgi:hypothetical protein
LKLLLIQQLTLKLLLKKLLQNKFSTSEKI